VPVPRFSRELEGGLAGLSIGVVRSLFEGDLIDSRIAAAVEAALAELRDGGARLVDVRIDLFEHFGAIQQCMQFPEAAEVHRDWLRERLQAYGEDVRARLLVGLFLPPTAYVLGQRARRLAVAAFEHALADVDLLAAPTMPVLPPRIGEDTVELPGGERIAYRLVVIPYNSPWSLVGVPVVSLPAGLVDGLPVGFSLVGRRFAEATLFRAAHAFQRLTDWHERRPELQPEEARA
jgi:aspartyl-tRNA(Asn)/glutamyl-tRNA(Gln) amidotransferase subunit A